MRFRQFLELMQNHFNLPDDVVVIRKVFAGGSGVIFYFGDAETHQETEGMSRDGFSGRPSGRIDIHRFDKTQPFRVGETVADDGWGPLLHDLAMEYATKYGIGLGPDSRENSLDSIAVWNFYFSSRPDVKKVKLPEANLNRHLLSQPSFQYIYTKADATTTAMRNSGQLVEL